jgi:signal transduction histidine kinase
MKQRTAFTIAWSVWTVSMVALLVPFAYRLTGHRVAGLGDQSGSVAAVVVVLLFIPTFATVGAVLVAKRPTNPVGWLVSASGFCYALGTFAILVGHFSTRWADWLANWVWGLGIGIPATFVLLLFPTGHLPSPRWRPVAWFAGAVLVALFLGSAFQPGVMQGTHSINPVGIGGPLGGVFKLFRDAFGLVFVAALGAVVSLFFRFRRAQSLEREQIKWLVYAAALLVVAAIAGSVVPSLVSSKELGNNLQNAIISGGFVFVPVAIGIAILKYRLYDLDVVIRKTVVFGLLAAFITVVYAGIVGGIGAIVGSKSSTGLSFVAAAALAVLFQPARDRARRVADRLVYGGRATPYEVLSEFSGRVGEAYAADDVLPRMAQVLAAGTGAEAAAVWLRLGAELRPAAVWPVGASAPPDDRVEVTHQTERLGELSVRMPASNPMNPAKRRLVEDLASQAGLVLRNVRLIEELRGSRQRLVAAQDEERRKIERNIHDGAQQQLVALAVKQRMAASIVGRDDERARAILEELQSETTQALEDLRDLARGVYPPLLADQGLAAALESQARKSPVPVEVVVDGVGRFPQEIEAAVYFSCLEALQNVAKYAGASGAVVRVAESGGELTFQVEDDGGGFDPASTGYGTGLQGMADRLDALGGRIDVRSAPGTGTRVTGRIPIPAIKAVT